MTSLDTNEKFAELWNSDNYHEKRRKSRFDTNFKWAVWIALLFALSMETYRVRNVIHDKNYTEVLEQDVDWWYRYNSVCCFETNVTKTYGIKDCKADQICYAYLDLWLQDFGERFNTSSWIRHCCYEFKPMNSLENSLTFCSSTCLNSQYIQHRKLIK